MRCKKEKEKEIIKKTKKIDVEEGREVEEGSRFLLTAEL